MPERLIVFKKNLKLVEDPKVLENRIAANEAGNFLNVSGISDVVIDFRQAFLGDMGELRNEINIEPEDFATSASLVLEWIEPDTLSHLIVKVSAGCSDNKEKYISVSFREIRHYKGKKHDPNLLEIYLLPLGRAFDFNSHVSNREKASYKKWLRDKALNYEHVWGSL